MTSIPDWLRLAPRRAAHWPIRVYQLTLSSLMGRQCRYLPTCSDYTDQCIQQHGLWKGGWIGLSRICRCHPWGDDGYDPAPLTASPGGRWFLPWRYGWWRRKPLESRFSCKPADPPSHVPVKP